jgi:hypothetical protein
VEDAGREGSAVDGVGCVGALVGGKSPGCMPWTLWYHLL